MAELQECLKKIVSHCRGATAEDCFACELLNQRTGHCFVGYNGKTEKNTIPKHWTLAVTTVEDIF